MKKLIALAIMFATLPAWADWPIGQNGKAVAQILLNRSSPATTKFAAEELSKTLADIIGAPVPILTEIDKSYSTVIFVGPSPAAAAAFAEVKFDQLAPEEIVIKSKPGQLLLVGGGARGTIYAVSRFLQEQAGVRWWTPWASRIPKNSNLAFKPLDVRYRPPFEMREPFWMPAFEGRWAALNNCNGQSSRIPDEMGGAIQYKGFVHTFYPLVPPEKHFNNHPEWFSLIKGKRTHERAQLCLTNPKLREVMTERVRQWLRESPKAKIISVSQNDWHGACQCDACKAVDEREGSHAGTMLDFVNHIAAQIEDEFPEVAVDTLAYQYTRKPPKTIRPRRNVIVRLCSIECNFREPLDHPSNAAFADDIRGWSKLTDRLYIWDYTTDFAHYTQPHPNWFVLGANVRFFAKHSVRGLFEQGAYQSHGSEMAELRAWVLAQLLWNPNQDDRALIREFLEGYFGAASPHIGSYLELMHKASEGHNLTCYSPVTAPFLQYQHLAPAERLWAKAEAAVSSNPELLIRVRLAHLPLRYVWLSRWNDLKKQAAGSDQPWPLPVEREAAVEEWKRVVAGQPDRPWTRVTLLNEGGLTPDEFLKRLK